MIKQPEQPPSVHITVHLCVFRRKKNSKVERGIMIGEGSIIIDSNIKVVKAPIWNYNILYHALSVQVEL